MSFLLRIAARAAPVSRAAPVLMPKNAGLRRAAPAASPDEEMPDEEMPARRSVRRMPIQRAEPEEQDEKLSRQEMEEKEEKEEPEAQRAALPPDDESEEEPPAGGVSRVIARETEEDEENLRPARALTSEDMAPENAKLPEEVAGEPEPPDLRAVRRADLPPEDEREPEAARAPAEMAEDEDDANMRPLRRAVGPIPTSATAPAAAAIDIDAGFDTVPSAPTGPDSLPAFNMMTFDGRNPPVEDFAVPSATAAPTPASFARPQVIIDQLDVVIHEPAPSPTRTARFDAGRALRARYLRRL